MTPEQRHKNMQRIRSVNTLPEISFRKRLWKEGFRYRKNWKALPGKPDIVLVQERICIFIDGEFFHGKNWSTERKKKVTAGNNGEYWVSKIEKNIQRDREVNAELNGMGWNVLRFWSRDVLKETDACILTVKETIFQQIIEQGNYGVED